MAKKALTPVAELPENARTYLNAILIGFRDLHGFGSEMNETDFLTAAHTLIETGAIKIQFDGERFRLVPTI
jgi:hypothetical protein